MRFFRSMIVGGLALFAMAAVSVNVSYANEWPVDRELSAAYNAEFGLVIAVGADVAEHVNLASADPVLKPPGVRSIGELKPEYMASYQTHGLNFIEVRSRC